VCPGPSRPLPAYRPGQIAPRGLLAYWRAESQRQEPQLLG
jgi:hypothetical protein